jgi:hypothetical protein
MATARNLPPTRDGSECRWDKHLAAAPHQSRRRTEVLDPLQMWYHRQATDLGLTRDQTASGSWPQGGSSSRMAVRVRFLAGLPQGPRSHSETTPRPVPLRRARCATGRPAGTARQHGCNAAGDGGGKASDGGARSELDLVRQQVPMVLQHMGHEDQISCEFFGAEAGGSTGVSWPGGTITGCALKRLRSTSTGSVLKPLRRACATTAT